MACVFPVVACELVRTCKLPTAALPVAVVRLLPFDGNTIHTHGAVSAAGPEVKLAQPRGGKKKKEVRPVLQLVYKGRAKQPEVCI